MTSLKLEQIILIHPERFFCEAIKLALHKNGIKVFYLEAPEEISHYIEDLNPQFIIIHEEFRDYYLDLIETDSRCLELSTNVSSENQIALPVELLSFADILLDKLNLEV